MKLESKYNIFNHENAFENVVCKMLIILFRPRHGKYLGRLFFTKVCSCHEFPTLTQSQFKKSQIKQQSKTLQ